VPFVQGSIDELVDLLQAVKQYQPAAIVHIDAIVDDLPCQQQRCASFTASQVNRSTPQLMSRKSLSGLCLLRLEDGVAQYIQSYRRFLQD